MSTLERGSEPAARMPSFRSLLYSQPQLYDLVFPDKDDAVGKMVRTAIGQYLPGCRGRCWTWGVVRADF